MPTLDTHLLDLLEDFHPLEDSPIRCARRPAGKRVMTETTTLPGGETQFRGLAHFWMESLYGFLRDSGSDVRWFEGLAYQSDFMELTPAEFHNEYRALQQRELTLPPQETVELSKAFRVLQGRLFSYTGVTIDGEYWAGTLGPSHCGTVED